MAEFLSTPHMHAYILVVLSSHPPCNELEQLMKNSLKYRLRMRYYIGNTNNPADLARVQAEHASIIYVVGDSYSYAPFFSSCMTAGNAVGGSGDILRHQEDSIYLNCIAINNYLSVNRTSKSAAATIPVSGRKVNTPLGHCSLPLPSSCGDRKPIVIPRLPFSACCRGMLLSKRYVHTALCTQARALYSANRECVVFYSTSCCIMQGLV